MSKLKGVKTFSERDKKSETINKFLKNLLGLIGLIIICYTIYKIRIHIKEFASFDTLRDFILSPLLALWFLPFLYVVSLYMTYEQYNISLSYKFDDKKLLKFVARQAFFKFNTDVKSFDRWRNTLYRDRPTTKGEIINSIKELKRLQKLEKHPPIVDESIGWSPYVAKDYLVSKGVPTRFYTKGYDDVWFASSDYIKLDNELAGNTLIYSIEGDETVAKTLSLHLNVNDPKSSKDAKMKLIEYASFLYTSALKVPLPQKTKNALICGENLVNSFDKVEIIVKKEKWLNHGKYSLSFSLNMSDK